jgi:hypothetical protein
MPRIVCDQPGYKPIVIRGTNSTTGETPLTIAEAPDFSIPDPEDAGSRIVVAGEIWFGTPLYLRNRSTSVTLTANVWIDGEDGSSLRVGIIEIPALETVAFPMQGQSLLKRLPGATFGDRLRMSGGEAGAIAYWATAYERRADEHIGL